MHHRASSDRSLGVILVALACAALSAAWAGAARAAEPADVARAFEAEAARLEAENDATQEAWQTQDALVRDLLDAAQAIESAYADPDATADELRAIDASYEAALGAAYRQARATIASRRRVYDQMDKLAALGRRIEAERRAVLDAPMPGGLWRFEIPGSDLVGILQLDVEGGSVSGSYRSSNGRRGSLSGTYAGGRLELQRVDSEVGRDAALSADVDEGAGTLEGEWVRYELAAGEPGSGRWTATRVSDESELPDLGE